MSDKKITAREAAIAVLKKAEELYKASSLSKGESKHDRCAKEVKENSPEVNNPHAVCVAEGVKPAKWSKSDESGNNPDEAADASLGEKLEQAVEEHYNEVEAKGKTPGEGSDKPEDAKLGERAEKEVHEHEARNADPAHEAPMKGHIKLAKFIGRMEHKRSKRAE